MDTTDEMQKWRAYQERTADSRPRPLLEKAVSHVQEKHAALDFGAGSLNDTKYLLDSGFKEVVAVDFTPQFREVVPPLTGKFLYLQTRFNEYEFPTNYFNLISAQYALPFVQKEDFEKVWTQIHDALKTGGIFTGQFFGEHDDWFGRNGMTFHTKNEMMKLVSGFESLVCNEREYAEEGERGKHWHYFDLILKKPAH